ncbi:hypothetical protein Q7P37_005160 [Cladosporium fusiforme]
MAATGSRPGALVIFGSGPGIGVHVAARFVRGGFEKVVLLSRNTKRLSDDAFIVYSNAPYTQISTVTVDLTEPEDLDRALRELEHVLAGTPVECINAAKTSESWLLEESSADLRLNLELSVTALYAVAQWAIPQLLRIAGKDGHKPAFLVTSGWLASAPLPNYFSLGVCKSAQQNIVHSLHDQLRPRGVHCALVMVDDVVSNEARHTNPANIAEESWRLYYSQGYGNMDLETHIQEEGGPGQRLR